MIGGIPISGADLSAIAQKGSPVLLHAVGRAFGLGAAERAALTRGEFPAWLWIVGGFAVGTVAGAFLHRKWPNNVDRLLKVG